MHHDFTFLKLHNRRVAVLAVGCAALVLIAAGIATALTRSSHLTQAELQTHTAHYEQLEFNIVDRAELEPARSRDIYCLVKAGIRNSTTATTIKWVIDEGTLVKKGDLLIELDDSGLWEQLKQQKIDLGKATAEKVVAEETYKIIKSQNDSDIKAAATAVELAQIDLHKYLEGDYPQALEDIQGRIKIAAADLKTQRERAAWASRMVKRGFQTVSQSQAEQSRLESQELGMDKFNDESHFLTDPGFGLRKRTEIDLAGKVAEAQQALLRIQSQAHSREAQALAERALKQSIHQQERQDYLDIKAEIGKCRITAPQGGMVIYCIPEQARRGDGSQQAIIAQGEPVREGQKLLQIPDLRQMVVYVRVQESLVSRVHPNLPASIRLDAYPGRVLRGHVVQVSETCSRQTRSTADSRWFETKVALDDKIDGLKPGMMAEVTLDAGATRRAVLTVPVEALVGSVEMGNRRRCYIQTSEGPEEREVVVGRSNNEMAEITDGLYEGEEVVLNPNEQVSVSAH